MRFCLLIGVLRPVAGLGVPLTSEAGAPSHRWTKAKDVTHGYRTASDSATDSAIIRAVEALPAAFVVDAQRRIRHVQRGPEQRT